MSQFFPIKRQEFGRFALLAILFFINTVVLESNEVVATSGFVSEAGVGQLLIVWALVMVTVLLSSSAYSLIVDQVDRERLAIIMFLAFGLVYLLMYFIFSTNIPARLSYGLLAILTEQHWIILPLLLYALANDVFEVTEAKRIFPVLTAPTILGSIAGNSIAAWVGQLVGGQVFQLLVFNAILILLGGLTLMLVLPRLELYKHTSANEGDRLRDIWEEGMGFIRDVPSFRYLTIAMILLGIGLNTIEFTFIGDVARFANGPGELTTVYGLFKLVTAIALLILAQSGLVGALLNKIGFKNVFLIMPGAMILSLIFALVWISPVVGLALVNGAIFGAFTTRLTLTGIDEPSRRAFQGLVPDQRRGRVSAFMDGYLYPLGSILGCAILGVIELLTVNQIITPGDRRIASLVIALAAVICAAWSIWQFREYYDTSMLNWRLKRRSRGKNILNKLDF